MTRQIWPAAERNKAPILEVLSRVLPGSGLVLEIASGSGQHAEHFARHLAVEWQPTDPDPENRASIGAWRDESGLPNLRPPLDLDVLSWPWPITQADAVYCANMVHITPWEVSEALFRHAGRVLGPGAPLVLYGPFQVEGAHTSESNARFDESLRARDPRWGVRDVGALDALARAVGLHLEQRIAMPANNQTLVWRRV